MTEREIIIGSREGKQKCQKLLYDSHCRIVMGICLRYTKNKEDAEDLFQNIFVTIFTKLDEFKFLGSFEGWIKKIAIHTIIDWLRRKQFLKNLDIIQFEDMDAQFIEEFFIEEEEEPLSQEDILNALNKLPDGYRTVINLFLIEKYTHREIAQMLGCSEETSRSQCYKGKRLLREKLMKK